MSIGKLLRVPLREVWAHEALGLTRWLEDNYDVLGSTLGLSLSSVEREQPAGDFSVDLVAEDQNGDLVVIENQLERSDHDHLGKLLTYLTALEAKAAVWIVSDPRPEHVGAMAWLNESTPVAFYLVKLEAVRIANSPPAPLFTLIVGPSPETRQVATEKRKVAERQHERQRFWTELLERANARTRLHANVSPTSRPYIGTGSGVGGLGYNYVVNQRDARVEMYIDRGREAEENETILDALEAHREEIEAAFGESLEWQRLEGKRASRIRYDMPLGGFEDTERWPELQEGLVDAMVRLERALSPFVARLAAQVAGTGVDTL